MNRRAFSGPEVGEPTRWGSKCIFLVTTQGRLRDTDDFEKAGEKKEKDGRGKETVAAAWIKSRTASIPAPKAQI